MKARARGGGEIALLEEIAANAVAPSAVQLLDGWLLRASPDAPFRRNNAVLPIRCDGGSLDERLVLVEEFYRRHGLPVRYQISPVVEPRDLDAVLAARGYAVEAPVLVQVARAADVAARTRRDAPGSVLVTPPNDASWLDAHVEAQDDPRQRARLEAYGRLLGRVSPRAVAARVEVPATGTVAVGFAVLERGWCGVFGMATRPAARRTGAASAILHAFAAAGLAAGAPSMYLQVEADNEPAQRLYGGAGFTTLYGYHYRSLDLLAGQG